MTYSGSFTPGNFSLWEVSRELTINLSRICANQLEIFRALVRINHLRVRSFARIPSVHLQELTFTFRSYSGHNSRSHFLSFFPEISPWCVFPRRVSPAEFLPGVTCFWCFIPTEVFPGGSFLESYLPGSFAPLPKTPGVCIGSFLPLPGSFLLGIFLHIK